MWINHLDTVGSEVDMMPAMEGMKRDNGLLPEQTKEVRELKVLAAINSAHCCNRLGRYQQAVEFANKALAIDSKHKKATYRRGQAYLKLGNIDGAETDLKASMENFKGTPELKDVERDYAVLQTKLTEYKKKERGLFAGMFDRLHKMDKRDESKEVNDEVAAFMAKFSESKTGVSNTGGTGRPAGDTSKKSSAIPSPVPSTDSAKSSSSVRSTAKSSESATTSPSSSSTVPASSSSAPLRATPTSCTVEEEVPDPPV